MRRGGGRQGEHFSMPHLPLTLRPVASSYTIMKHANYGVIRVSLLCITLTFILYKLYFTLMCLCMYTQCTEIVFTLAPSMCALHSQLNTTAVANGGQADSEMVCFCTFR